MQNLQQFAAFGKVAITVDQTGAKPFQKLLFLVRDWSPVNHEAPFGLGGGRYLIDKRFDAVAEMKSTRDQILAAFEAIECFLMPHPGLDAIEEPKFKGRLKDVRPKFKDHLKDLVPHILAPEKLIQKVSYGSILKARDFVNVFEANVECFNSNKAPKAENVFEANVKCNNANAREDCFDYYVDCFKTFFKGALSYIIDYDKGHAILLSRALAQFDKLTKFGGIAYSQKDRDKLKQRIEQLYKSSREVVMLELKRKGTVSLVVICAIVVVLVCAPEIALVAISGAIIAGAEWVKLKAIQLKNLDVGQYVIDLIDSCFNGARYLF